MTRLLGKGAQAWVYLAFDARLKQWRAIKVLDSDFISDSHVRQRFEIEAEAMARLNHRNLLRVVDIDSDGATPFIVMELARGGAITDWLRRNGKMSPRQAVEVVIQACDGLHHAHSLGVVHRDVKPHNLLIAEDSRILLTDFGIAQIASGSASMTLTGSVMGTFAYMAPEQRNDAKGVDARADVYALGASLYTIVSLRTSAELFFAEARDEILEAVPEALRPVILDACRYDREERFPSVAALKEALLEVMPRLPYVPSRPLTDALTELPEVPPEFLSPDSGVEGLRASLSTGDETPTYVSGTRLDELLEEQSTTLYSDTDAGEGPKDTPLYASARSGFARSSLEELSAEPPPPMDLSTMDREPLYLDAPAPPPEPVKVITGAPGPVSAVELHTTEPASVRSAPRIYYGVVGSVLLLPVLAVTILVLSFVGYGVVDKLFAGLGYERAGSALVQTVEDQHSLIEELAEAGADQKRLETSWFEIQDAPRLEQPVAAAAFVEVVLEESEDISLGNIGQIQVAQLRSSRSEWVAAADALQAARSSWSGRISGDLGLPRP